MQQGEVGQDGAEPVEDEDECNTPMVVDSDGMIEYEWFAEITSRRIDECLTPSLLAGSPRTT